MLLFDLQALSARQTDGVLEYVYKAIGHDHEGGEWDEHPSPLVRTLVELFTQRGLSRLASVRTELQAWMAGEKHRPGALRPRPAADGTMYRWTPGETDLVALYLESLPLEAWTVDDHMLMCELVVQKHLPQDVVRTEAHWLATKATLMGRVQAALGDGVTQVQADRLLEALPSSPNVAKNEMGLTAAQVQVLDFAANRAAEHVSSLTDTARHQMRGIIARDAEARALGDPLAGRALEGQLLDAFGTLNRDWRRIAVTEATEALDQGMVASMRPGQKLRRVERYKDACSWCRKIHGMVVNVVDPSDPDKDGFADVWVGKTNVGRSAAPRKRVGDLLVDREPDERYWLAAGSQHPHCRGTWQPVADEDDGDVDPDFTAWAKRVLKGEE